MNPPAYFYKRQPVLLQYHPPTGRSQRVTNGQKQKKKILFPLVVGAELKLPLRRQLTALTCLLLTSVEKMTTLLVLFQIDQVFNPRGLGALKYLCEGLSQ